MQNNLNSGVFVVVEGIDKSGKTTVVQNVYEKLSVQYPVKKISFPDRNTKIGGLINEYLKGGCDLSPETIHLLFTADRYNHSSLIKETIKQKQILLCDRYSWSGISCTVAKGVSLSWCIETERLLPKPDLTIYLDANVEALSTRKGYGSEILENKEFQQKIKEVYSQMKDFVDNVVTIDASLPLDQIIEIANLNILECVKNKNYHVCF